jgi:MFS family permease
MEQRWRIFTLTSVGLFMASLDLFIVNIAFPAIGQDFPGASLSDLSWVLDAYAIVFAALLVPAGRFADRIGRKRVFIAGLLTFTAASAASAAAPPAAWTTATDRRRGGGGPGRAQLALDLHRQRPHRADHRPPCGAVAGRGSRASRSPAAGRRRRPPAVAGIGLLTGAIVKGPDWGWGDPRIVGGFAAAAALVVWFAARSARHPAPVIEPSMLRVRNFALANLAAMIFFAGFGAMLLAGVLYLTQVWDYSILHAGVALSPGPLTAALSAPSGRLGGRIGQRPIAALGGLTFAGSFALLLAVAGASPDYAGAFLPDFLLAGAGVGMVLGTLPAAATASLPPSRFATGTAVFGMARQLGAAIGVAVLVALLADPAPDALLGALRHGWAFMVGTGLGTAALSLALGPVRAEEATARKPDVAPQPQPAAAK